ncbi:hypothetical protein ACIPID_16655, partial [Cupriavidus sp. CER94]|uniref:hypothetical protein n=1 Tax=Cupriavidus sp. CER94 TaxID=3377036 RepID=UPI0038116F04
MQVVHDVLDAGFRSGRLQRSAMNRMPRWPASASRDANLLGRVVRCNLPLPFAYAPERTAAPPAIARLAAAGLDFVLQQAPRGNRSRDIPLAGPWRTRATPERATDARTCARPVYLATSA